MKKKTPFIKAHPKPTNAREKLSTAQMIAVLLEQILADSIVYVCAVDIFILARTKRERKKNIQTKPSIVTIEQLYLLNQTNRIDIFLYSLFGMSGICDKCPLNDRLL